MGRTKQLEPLAGRPLLQHVIDAAATVPVREVVIVLGHDAEEVASAIVLPANARIELNTRHQTGQASSLRVGISGLSNDVDRAVVLLGDQPGVSPAAIQAVAAGADPITRVRYSDGPGHPVAFARELWPQLLAIDGDRGARDLIAARPDRVGEIVVDAPAPRDVDTDADLRALG